MTFRVPDFIQQKQKQKRKKQNTKQNTQITSKSNKGKYHDLHWASGLPALALINSYLPMSQALLKVKILRASSASSCQQNRSVQCSPLNFKGRNSLETHPALGPGTSSAQYQGRCLLQSSEGLWMPRHPACPANYKWSEYKSEVGSVIITPAFQYLVQHEQSVYIQQKQKTSTQ